MTDPDPLIERAELLERVRRLELENEDLTQRAEDVFLLGLLAEVLSTLEDPLTILEVGLERVCILKDLPFCGCGTFAEGRVELLASYASFSQQRRPYEEFHLPGDVEEQLPGGAVLLGPAECSQLGLGLDEAERFTPRSALLIPFATRAHAAGVFVFADDSEDERLPELTLMLHRVVDLFASRLDKLALLEEMHRLNGELDRKVADRTAELLDVNRGLEAEVKERIRVEAELRESEERFRRVMEGAGDGFFIIDQRARIVDVNQQACQSLGYRREELLRLTAQEVDSIWSLEEVRGVFLRLEKEPRLTLKGEQRRKDGTLFPAEVRVSLLEVGDQPLILALVRDVSERTSLEAQLLQAQKMECVGRLAGGVAHDFNNLLSGVLGYSDLLLAALPPGDPSEEGIRVILEAGERACDLTKQLLFFSRKQQLEVKVIQLGDQIERTSVMLHRLLGGDVALELDLAEDAPNAEVDLTQLEQVLLNLAVNARDAMPDGGRIVVTLRHAELDRAQATPLELEPGSYLELGFRDTGVGMPEEVRAQIFEPFFTTKPLGRGTGLGLSTVYGIVKQHGGGLRVDSQPGQGTTFWIYLPTVDREATVEPLAAVGPMPTGSETILVVDDSPAILRLTRDVLVPLGYQVHEATSAEEALVRLEEPSRVDLILSDVVLPGRSGVDLLEGLVSRPDAPRVLLMSGFTDDHEALRRARAGGTPFLAKPLRPGELARTVRAVLDSGRPG